MWRVSVMDTEEYLRGKAEERDPRKRKRLSSEMGYDGDRVEERSRWVVRVVWWFTVVVSVSGDMINCSIRSRERSNRRGRSRSRSGSKEDSRYSRRERGGGQAQGQEDDWRKRSDAFLQKLSGLPTDPRLAVQAARQQSYQVRPCQLLSAPVRCGNSVVLQGYNYPGQAPPPQGVPTAGYPGTGQYPPGYAHNYPPQYDQGNVSPPLNVLAVNDFHPTVH